jgi:PmbA protein
LAEGVDFLDASIKDLAAKSAAEAGFSAWEVSLSETDSFETRFFNREIAQYKNAKLSTLTFRGEFEGKTGYATTELLNAAAISEIIQKARANAEIMNNGAEKIFEGAKEYLAAPAYNAKLDEFPDSEKVGLCAELEQAAYAADSLVKSVDHAVLSTQKTALTLINSFGLDISHAGNSAYAFVSARAERDGETKLSGEFWFGNDLGTLNVQDLAKEAVLKTVARFGAKPVKTGEYPVVIENMAVCGLLGAFVSAFYAENIQKGASLLKGRLGERVFADFITLRDDAVYGESPANVAFDSSGTPAANKELVVNGKLNSYMYSLKAAAKDGVTPTGNSFGNGTRHIHFYIEPRGGRVLDDMGDGILITDFSGIHAGTNAVSGDFSLLANGFVTRGGRRAEPVEQIAVAGNFYDFMRALKSAGGDLRFTPGQARVGAPSLYAGIMKISGD